MLPSISGVVSRHPLATFVVLAYAFAWWPVLPFGGRLFSYGPFIAVLIVLALTEGRPGIGVLLRRLGYWRVGIGWYGIAIGLPIAVHVGASILEIMLGAPTPTLAQAPDWSALALTVVTLLAIGGQWEEPGWRGYGQPSLEASRSALIAALLLGMIGIGWHLPLMLNGLLPWSELLVIPALYVVWAWAYNSTGGSLLIAVLFHFASNLTGALIPPLFAGPDAAQRGGSSRSCGVWRRWWLPCWRGLLDCRERHQLCRRQTSRPQLARGTTCRHRPTTSQELELVDLALSLAVAPRQRKPGFDHGCECLASRQVVSTIVTVLTKIAGEARGGGQVCR